MFRASEETGGAVERDFVATLQQAHDATLAATETSPIAPRQIKSNRVESI